MPVTLPQMSGMVGGPAFLDASTELKSTSPGASRPGLEAASGTIYYVSNSGNDASAGTSPSDAWATLNPVRSATLSPGDQVLFRRGDAFSGELYINESGTATAPIVFGAYGTGPKPVFEGGVAASELTWTNEGGGVWSAEAPRQDGFLGVWDLSDDYPYAHDDELSFVRNHPGSHYLDEASGRVHVHTRNGARPDSEIMLAKEGAAFWCANQSYLRFENLRFQYGTYGAFANDCDGLVFDSVEAISTSYYGIEAYDSADLIVRNSLFERNGRHRGGGGVSVLWEGSTGALIEGNTFRMNGGHPLLTQTGDLYRAWGGGPQIGVGASGGIIRNNHVECTGRDPSTGKSGLFSDIGIDLENDADGHEVYRNTVIGCVQGITAYGGSQDNIIVHNTVWDFHDVDEEELGFGLAAAGIYLGPGSTGAVVKNNIVATERAFENARFYGAVVVAGDAKSGSSINHNLYYVPNAGHLFEWGFNGDDNWSQWRSRSGHDSNSPAPTAPLFANASEKDFTLRLRSPAVDSGQLLPGYEADYEGDAPDLGAVESAAGPPPDEGASHAIAIRQGWNLISSWVSPEDDSLEVVFEEVLSKIVLVKDETGRTFMPHEGIDRIEAWDAREAYMVYATASDTFRITGTPFGASPASVPLERGWNLLPYLHDAPLPITEVLSGIAEYVVLAKDYSGATYFPRDGIDQIGLMRPGRGYKVFLSQDAELTYPVATP